MTSKRICAALLVPAFLAVFAAAAWATDSDSDGLPDDYERDYGTDKDLADTDGDSLSDWAEIAVTGTDPTMADTDGDSEDDGADTAPLDPGTDLDGGTTVSFSSYPTSTGFALSGVTPMDGCGVMVHDGRLTYSLDVAQAKGVRLPFSLGAHYDSSWQWDGYLGNWGCDIDAKYTVNGYGDVTVRRPPYGAMTWVKSGSTYCGV